MSPEDAPPDSDGPDSTSLGPDVPRVELPDLATDAVTDEERPADGGSGEDEQADDATAEVSAADADPETQALFWKLVMTFDIALPAVALGALFLYFDGRLRIGVILVSAGLALFGWGAYQAYRFTREGDADRTRSN